MALAHDGLPRRLRRRMERLYPLCRSLTGDGVRQTLAILADDLPQEFPLQVHRVPSGTQVFDWTIPPEWNAHAAWIADAATGERLVDLARHSLHLVSYSVPFEGRLDREALEPHLHSLPDRPAWIPYRTTYYARDWGFCLTQRQRDRLGPGPFDVLVDTTLDDAGELVYGELVLPGTGDRADGDVAEEVLISSHVCHPSLVNDNLTGLTVATELARRIAGRRHRLTYRFVFAPGTIGSLTWLADHPGVRPAHLLVLTGLGGGGPLVYKRTRHGDRPIDRAAAHVVGRREGRIIDYSPYGYDERQYNALGFDLPAGRLTRTPHGEYPEYHTSADSLSFVHDAELVEALTAIEEILEVLEGDASYLNLSPYGEPQLGRRGLYPKVGGRSADDAVMAMLWLLACADGDTPILAIAERAGLPFRVLRKAADDLVEAGLLG
jgi:aminopeptidase-like protein